MGEALLQALLVTTGGTPQGTMQLRGVSSGSYGGGCCTVPLKLPAAALLQALSRMAAHAPTEALSRTTVSALEAFLGALIPRHRAALLGAALPACPYPAFVARALGWVQRDLRSAAECSAAFAASAAGRTRGPPMAPNDALSIVSSVVGARLERGLLLHGRKEGWPELLASEAVGGGGGAREALARRVSTVLLEEAPVDVAVLCLLRALLLQQQQQQQQIAAGGALQNTASPPLLPQKAATLLREAYAMPLMAGLVEAQRLAREDVGLHSLHAHASPFEEAGGEQQQLEPHRERVQKMRESGALSAHFLLEGALAPALELLDAACRARQG